ncbi:alpha/beta fold hydrolase [Crossiella sp. CA-258035]|uniref:alpha/beta fold hydrolase n=1 Tax=Crossiella sp. CA-258035 TaxID=2981138 RepID=UPI0024BC4D59|nr:alpha/beta fold hydrolase [Crossiella sp. CA-258035]WHT23301.1 alpha/beta fold hydrolase [Crossiella sp. CA-258035]
MTDHLSHGEKLLDLNGVELCVETFGNPADPAILLIDGAAASMLWWETELCEQIARGDRFMIRYDNRDTGRSTSYPPGRPGYAYTDLAADALGVLDALGVERAHIVCRSMSGGIGLLLGVDHPGRVASLTFVSTSTGADGLPPSAPELASGIPADPDPADAGAVVDFVVASAKACSGGSPHFDETATRALVERDVARARDIAATLVNHYAMSFDGSARDFAAITAPTLVVHGDLDPVCPLPHGHALREAVPGARLLVLAGAGHDLPRPLWEVFVPALLQHTRVLPELFDYDAELRQHNELFRAAARIGARDRVLDIGCGAGQTTREAARAAVDGSVVGVDVSAPMLERARGLSAEQGLTNITFQQTDAQAHRFPPASFDLCISRFGTMFFADPVAAFTNIGRALRPGARLVLLVWQGRDRNEWATAIRESLTATPATPVGPDAFSLADPAATEEVLAAAGFTGISFTDVHVPVYYGPDSATALDAVLRLLKFGDLLAGLDPAAAEQARTRLRATLDAHTTGSGVLFDSRAWIVTAHRRP